MDAVQLNLRSTPCDINGVSAKVPMGRTSSLLVDVDAENGTCYTEGLRTVVKKSVLYSGFTTHSTCGTDCITLNRA